MAHSSRKKPASRAALVCALVCAFGLAACAGRPDAEGEGLEPRRSGVPQSLTAQGSVSQRFQAQTDRSLNGDNDPVFGATTRLGATAGFSTPRAGVSFNGGVSGSGFFGPGSTDGLTRIDPDAQIEAFYRVARLDFSGLLDFDIQPTSVTQVEDTGVTQEGTAQVDLRLGADLAYLINARNRLTLGGEAAITRFTRGATTLTPTTVYGLRGGWVNQVDARTAATMSVGLRRFIADNPERERSTTLNVGGQISREVNERLSLSGGAGVNVVRRTETQGGARDTDTLPSASGNFAVAWTPTSDLAVGFGFDHGVQPSSAGELRMTTTASLEFDYALTKIHRAGLALAYSRRSGLDDGLGDSGARNLFTLRPSLSVQLDPDWRMELSYAMRAVDEPGNQAVSNAVTLGFSRGFELAR